MATPRLNQLSIDLSRLLNDEVGTATDNGEEFTANQRLLALNRAEGMLISKAVSEQDIKTLERNFNELIRDASTSIGNAPQNSPAGSAKVLRAYTGASYMIPVDALDWYAVLKGYNEEEQANYDTLPQFQWTEYGKQVHWIPNSSTIVVTMLYIKDHVDLTYNGANDFLVPARFDAEILKLAYEFLTQILVKE